MIPVQNNQKNTKPLIIVIIVLSVILLGALLSAAYLAGRKY